MVNLALTSSFTVMMHPVWALINVLAMGMGKMRYLT